MSFDDGFILGLSLGGGSTPDIWQPPSHWPALPVSGDYDASFVMYVRKANSRLSAITTHPPSGADGDINFNVDWGDGTTEEYTLLSTDEYLQMDHDYYNVLPDEQYHYYPVKVTGNKPFGMRNASYTLMADLGKYVYITKNSSGYSIFRENGNVAYIKFNGVLDGVTHAFSNCYSLAKIDTIEPITQIPNYTFYACNNLIKVDLSEVQTVGQYGINNTALKKIDMPKCTSISKNSISNNYSLQELNLPLCTEIPYYGIEFNSTLKEIYIPMCTTIQSNGMRNNYALRKLTVAENCTMYDRSIDYVHQIEKIIYQGGTT